MLFYILYLSLVTRVSALYININYSFKLPEVFGIGNHNDSSCCPFLIYPKNDTGGLRVPDFLIIGVQKASSSALAGALKSHPSVIMSDKQELNWLSEDGIIANHSYQEYLKHWDINYSDNITTSIDNNVTLYSNETIYSDTKMLLFEATPDYLVITMAACKMKYYMPNAKLIVIFRDPVDRVYSDYKYTRRKCILRNRTSCAPLIMSLYEIAQSGIELLQKSACSFNTGFGNLTYNDCFKCLVTSHWINPPSRHLKMLFRFGFKQEEYEESIYAREIILRGLYGAQMAWWFHFFKPKQFMLISYLDFVQDDTIGVLNRIVDFVGLEKHYQQKVVSKVRDRKEHNEEDDKDGSVAKGYKILTKFYKRPNLEFYKLLIDNGHDFRPFEEELRYHDFIDCGDYLTAKSGICGDQNSLNDLEPLTTQEMIEYAKKTVKMKVSKKEHEYFEIDLSEDLSEESFNSDNEILENENYSPGPEKHSPEVNVQTFEDTIGKNINLHIDKLNRENFRYGEVILYNHNKRRVYHRFHPQNYVFCIFTITIIVLMLNNCI